MCGELGMQISIGDERENQGKCRSRFPSGMTERKARASAEAGATAEADLFGGITERKASGTRTVQVRIETGSRWR
jgi:hypothetical protein